MGRRGAGPRHGDDGLRVPGGVEIAEEEDVAVLAGDRQAADALADAEALRGPDDDLRRMLRRGGDGGQHAEARGLLPPDAGRPAQGADGDNRGRTRDRMGFAWHRLSQRNQP